MATTQNIPMAEIKKKTQSILKDLSGLISIKVLNIGLNLDLFSTIKQMNSAVTADQLANKLDLDPIYLEHWLGSAYACNYLELVNDNPVSYQLAKFIDLLLLNPEFPGYIGGFPGLFDMDEVFDWFESNMQSGDRIWWEDASPSWIKQVSSTAIPMYTRLVTKDFKQIPELTDKLHQGAKVLELACGTGKGLSKLASTYTDSEFIGLDGDEYSLKLAKQTVISDGIDERVSFVHSWFEDLEEINEFDIVIINASMHECRNIDEVTQNVYRALKPGGIFVISDIPYPEDMMEYRTIKNRLLLGINFWELQIDDTLLPANSYVDLLKSHQFDSVNSFDSTPTHCIVYGYKNQS